MGLPEVDSLLSLPREAWAALGRRLRAIGVESATVNPMWQMALRGNPLRSPTVKWHLRRQREASALAMRMLMFWDPVTPAEARKVLGEETLLERLLEAGFLRRTPEGGVVSSFALKLADEGRLYVFCDDAEPGGDTVMGPSPATLALASFARPRVRAARALDMGCGPGTIALTMAPMCDRVVATDISPRAITVAKVNAWVNGIDNVEFLAGDLFDPVGDETFDVVASQPPFVSKPPGVAAATFLFGGDRGDELALRLLRELPPRLAPGGLAALMIVWPIIEGDPRLPDRLRDALGACRDLSLLILQSASGEELVHGTCAAYARIRNGSDETGYERDVLMFREHFEQQRIRSLADTYTFVRRGRGEDVGWTSVVIATELGKALATRESVDLLLQTGDRALRAASAATGSPGREVTIDVKATIPVRSVLAMAESLAATGRGFQALPLYLDVQRNQPAWRSATLGAARWEIASGKADDWRSRLVPIAEQGSREARRLLGDIEWKRGELDAALVWYAIEPRGPAGARRAYAPPLVEARIRVTRRRARERRFLVWVTCPSFAGAVAGQGLRVDRSRLWDLAVNRFDSSNEDVDDRAEYVVEGGVSKLSSVKATVVAHPGIFDEYEAVLLLDDDIGIAHDAIDNFFWLMSRHQLDLAHPSFSDASVGPFPAMFRQRESLVRFTNTVDIRAPAFSRAGLRVCLDSFDQSISGEGLGAVWSRLLEDRKHAVGVVDAVTVSHLRPIDPIDGPFYRHLAALGIDPTREMHDVHRRFGCWFLWPRTIGDVDAAGRERHYDDLRSPGPRLGEGEKPA